MEETVRSILGSKGNDVWSVPPDATVYQALLMMADKDVGALLVISEGRLAGIVSERDYARKVILRDKSSRETLVSEIMKAAVVTVTPDHRVEECMRIMTAHRVRHLPVLQNDRVIGVVSIGDLVNSIISEQAATINQLNNYIVGNYPA